MSLIPKRRFYGQNFNLLIHTLQLQRETAQRNGSQALPGERLVMGYRIPSWQRAPVWTDSQAVHFVQSVYLGANIGSIMVNSSETEAFDRILLDGQQRLMAIERYWADEFPVPGETDRDENGLTGDEPKPAFWSELSQHQQAHFLRIPFPCIETAYRDEALMREAYNRHNFGGTPHRMDEKADDVRDLLTEPPTFRRW
jgi:hypothetical protein